MDGKEIIFIVDDDKSVRRSLLMFLSAEGYLVEAFSSSEEYLSREPHEGPGCIILDVNLTGKTGMELQDELISRDSHLPIIFITGHGNIPMSVDALKKGAVNFLEKPFSEKELLRSVSEAILLSRKTTGVKAETDQCKRLVGTLTRRETEILSLLISGMLNKQIAHKLNIAEQTVKIHRRKVCDKLAVKSTLDLLRIAVNAGIIPSENSF